MYSDEKLSEVKSMNFIPLNYLQKIHFGDELIRIDGLSGLSVATERWIIKGAIYNGEFLQ